MSLLPLPVIVAILLWCPHAKVLRGKKNDEILAHEFTNDLRVGEKEGNDDISRQIRWNRCRSRSVSHVLFLHLCFLPFLVLILCLPPAYRMTRQSWREDGKLLAPIYSVNRKKKKVQRFRFLENLLFEDLPQRVLRTYRNRIQIVFLVSPALLVMCFWIESFSCFLSARFVCQMIEKRKKEKKRKVRHRCSESVGIRTLHTFCRLVAKDSIL